MLQPILARRFLLVRVFSTTTPPPNAPSSVAGNKNGSTRYAAAAQMKRTRKGSTTNEKTLPNLFSPDLALDSPFGPTLITDLKLGDSTKANETKSVLLNKYNLEESTLNQLTLLSAGLLEYEPTIVSDKNRGVIPVLFTNYPTVAASQLMVLLTEHVSNSLHTELLEVNSRRVLQIGKAMSRFLRAQQKSQAAATEEELQLVSKLQLRQEANSSRFLHIQGTYSLARSQLRDHFLPGLGYIIKSLCAHSSSQPKILLIKDLPTFFESIENKRALQDWMQDLYENDVEMPPVMLTGFDFTKYDHAASQHSTLDVPSSSCESFEMDVYRFRLAQSRLAAANPSKYAAGQEDPALMASSQMAPKESSTQTQSKVWIPSKPSSCFIEDGGVVVYSVAPSVSPAKSRLFEQQIRKDESEIIFKWNWIQISRHVPVAQAYEEAPQDIRGFLSQKLLHEDEIDAILVLAKGKLFGTTKEAPGIDELHEAVRSFFASQPSHTSPANTLLLDQSSLGKHEKRFLPSLIQPGQVKVKFEDIGALDSAKEVLKEVITMPIKRPELFSVGILKESVSGVLLFGPPGTGKSLLAKAVAAECGASFLAVNLSTIFDMWVGEGEKNVKGMFSLARKIAPCVIFIDEVDALLQARSMSPYTRSGQLEVINEFMSEWDGINSGLNNGIIIMAATNRPFALDDAVLRRLPRRIMIDLPDEAARNKILSLLLKEDTVHEDIKIEDIAKRTSGYSGSDLKNLCQAAAFASRRREELTIRMEDFEKALNEIAPSISDEMLSIANLRKWDQQFGEGSLHNRRQKSKIGF